MNRTSLSARSSGSESYLVLWSRDRWKGLKRNGEAGRPLELLYGGIHISTPSFSRYGVAPGDRVYVGAVDQGRLLLLACMKVREIIPVTDYLRDHLKIPGAIASLHLWEIEKRLGTDRRDLGHRLPYGCIDEAVVGEEGTRFRFDLAVPLEILQTLTFVNKQGLERVVKVDDGRFKSHTGMQGHVLRLAAASAQDFLELTRSAAKVS